MPYLNLLFPNKKGEAGSGNKGAELPLVTRSVKGERIRKRSTKKYILFKGEENMKKSTRNKALVLALAGVMTIGGIAAYFTDGDTQTNTFTVGKISLDLQEPNWNPPEDITPEQEIPKDPQIKNDGINDEYVFLEVVVPYANVTIASDDGTKAPEKKDTELFSYDVKDGWVEVGTAKKDTANKTVTHLYAYGTNDAMTVLGKNVTTGSLFDWVKFANVVEDEALEQTTQNIVVNAYGIQTKNIDDGKVSLDGMNDDGKVAPADVWAVLSKQAPSTVVADPENVNTDIKNQ